MVTDIPATTNASFGREVVVYESPQPSAGIHRLVFVLFQQLGRDTVISPQLRHNFNSRNFAENNNLTPVAAAYVNCQRERELQKVIFDTRACHSDTSMAETEKRRR
ncbi:Protein FLOWERING LOCUS T [Vigna unguiculata]|uniref:Protein FLOWERING LOCUS T n=1 Tax=Vigna unguiculata TaxID=3917 RepID=A0A4D6NE66_VIGUN|nr:Protein FLOWERING LOCUS T [Vigna unguiculata]